MSFDKIVVVLNLKHNKNEKWNILFIFNVNNYIIYRIHYKNIIVVIFLEFIRDNVFSLCFIDDVNSRNVLIMNNARIHKNIELQIVCKNVNVLLIYFSFYSSNYNFIEVLFIILKTWIKRNIYLTKIYTKKKFDLFFYKII